MESADTSMLTPGLLETLPTHGWRLVRERAASEFQRRQQIWLAPASQERWWQLSVTHVEGTRRILAEPEPVSVIPSRRDRR